MPELFANADLGIVPSRGPSSGNEAHSTRTILEFMSNGVPVVVSKTRIDSSSFDASVVRFFEPGDDEALAAAMLEILENKELRQQMVARGYEYAERYGWNEKKQEYFQLVDRLCTEVFDQPAPAN